MSKSLLPHNATDFETALESSALLGEPLSIPISTLWDPQHCPVEFLPWLAWAVGVEEWDATWPESVRRSVIEKTPDIRRHRGTVWAVRQALIAAGYANAVIDEGLPYLTYDGSALFNGIDDFSGGSRWAIFRITADIGENKQVTAEERDRVIRLIDLAKPVRSVQRTLSYRSTVADELEMLDPAHLTVQPHLTEMRDWGIRYNGEIKYNNATRLPRKPQHFNGSQWYNGLVAYDGKKEQHDWVVTGARYNNQWDDLNAIIVYLGGRDRVETQPHFNGQAGFDGALTYGADQPPAQDAGAMTIHMRRRYNGRLHFNGARHYRGNAAIHASI